MMSAAITPAVSKKIKWISNVRVELVGPQGIISSRPVEDADRISFDLTTFGLPGNLTFSVQIYAPSITDIIKHRSYRDQFYAGVWSIYILGLLVKSDLIAGGVRAFSPGSIGGGFVGGWDNNDLLAYWSLGDPGNTDGGHIEAGFYNVAVMAEGDALTSFALKLV